MESFIMPLFSCCFLSVIQNHRKPWSNDVLSVYSYNKVLCARRIEGPMRSNGAHHPRIAEVHKCPRQVSSTPLQSSLSKPFQTLWYFLTAHFDRGLSICPQNLFSLSVLSFIFKILKFAVWFEIALFGMPFTVCTIQCSGSSRALN